MLTLTTGTITTTGGAGTSPPSIGDSNGGAGVNGVNNAVPSGNWAADGFVTAVRDQGSCGSCWAFTAVAAMESALLIEQKGVFIADFSEQELLDCVR